MTFNRHVTVSDKWNPKILVLGCEGYYFIFTNVENCTLYSLFKRHVDFDIGKIDLIFYGHERDINCQCEIAQKLLKICEISFIVSDSKTHLTRRKFDVKSNSNRFPISFKLRSWPKSRMRRTRVYRACATYRFGGA